MIEPSEPERKLSRFRILALFPVVAVPANPGWFAVLIAAVEIAATQSLTALEQKMTKGKPFDDGNLKALAKLAEQYRGNKAAERAAHLRELAKLKFE